ncbi:hypothetical protein [Rheinheimera sp.]|uniref:hypothetical protein n=1 Tax=Rheinheimera sp. TaxID=1869214 RepID=UPI00404892EA
MLSSTISSTGEQITSVDIKSLKRGDIKLPDDAVVIVISESTSTSLPDKRLAAQNTHGVLANLIRALSADGSLSRHFVTALESALVTTALQANRQGDANLENVLEQVLKRREHFPLTRLGSSAQIKHVEQLNANDLVPSKSPTAVGLNLSNPEKLRAKVLTSTAWLTAQELSKGAGYKNVNTSAQPNKWKRESKIFAVSQDGRDLFPEYALGDDGKPLPAIKNILKIFDGKMSAWSIAAWFASGNSWLGGDTPMSKLKAQPDAVLKAAHMEMTPSEHG